MRGKHREPASRTQISIEESVNLLASSKIWVA